MRRLRQEELRPEDPLRPDRETEIDMKRDNPFEFDGRYEISRHGVMISWLAGQTVKPSNPEYETNKHLYWADAYVRPEYRRQGIGSSWLPLLLNVMDRHGCTVLGMGAEDPPGHAFLQAIGAEPKLSEVESRLDLAQLDWEMMRRWAAEGAERSPQTRLEIYDGDLPMAMWDEFASQLSALLNTMPLENLDLGDIVVTSERLRDWSERRKLTGEVEHTVITREPDGVISGITNTVWAAHRPDHIFQEFTGVRPDARGRGLGKWIKAAMLVHIRDLYPNARMVWTGNAQSNSAMRSINIKMGFKTYKIETEYQISREQLAARIQSLKSASPAGRSEPKG